MPLQLEMNLLNKTPAQLADERMDRIEASVDKVRRGVFAKATDLSLRLTYLESEIEALKHQLWVMGESR